MPVLPVAFSDFLCLFPNLFAQTEGRQHFDSFANAQDETADFPRILYSDRK